MPRRVGGGRWGQEERALPLRPDRDFQLTLLIRILFLPRSFDTPICSAVRQSMGFVSKLTVSAVGLFSKAILNSGFCASVSVQGLDNLVKALEDPERDNGRGVITGTYTTELSSITLQ